MSKPCSRGLHHSSCGRRWTDSWLPDGPNKSFASVLFQAIPRRRRQRSVLEGLTNRSWVLDISGAPTAAVLCDYVLLWEKLENVQLQPNEPDRFIWKWTPDGKYSASSAYKSFIGMKSLVGAKHLWRVSAPPKVKFFFFFWIALHGRLWTADRRKRHGLQQDAACALCSQEDETYDHLLASCVVAREVWLRLLHQVGLQSLAPQQDAVLADWWQQARKAVPKQARRGEALTQQFC